MCTAGLSSEHLFSFVLLSLLREARHPGSFYALIVMLSGWYPAGIPVFDLFWRTSRAGPRFVPLFSKFTTEQTTVQSRKEFKAQKHA